MQVFSSRSVFTISHFVPHLREERQILFCAALKSAHLHLHTPHTQKADFQPDSILCFRGDECQSVTPPPPLCPTGQGGEDVGEGTEKQRRVSDPGSQPTSPSGCHAGSRHERGNESGEREMDGGPIGHFSLTLSAGGVAGLGTGCPAWATVFQERDITQPNNVLLIPLTTLGL